MASMRSVALAVMLCFSLGTSATDVWKNQPADAEFVLGKSVTLGCSLDVEIKKCSWFRDDVLLPLDDTNHKLSKWSSDKKDCQLSITKASVVDAKTWKCIVETSTETLSSKVAQLTAKSSPSAPEVIVDKTYKLAGNAVTLVPANRTYDFEVTVKNSYPPLQEGDFVVYRDGDVINANAKLEPSTDVSEAMNLIAKFQARVDKSTLFVFETNHPFITVNNGKRETKIKLKTDELEVDFEAIARTTTDTGTFEFEVKDDTGLTISSGTTFTWFQQKDGTWEKLKEQVKNKIKSEIQVPGNYTFRVSGVQEKVFNIKYDSRPLHLLVYEPLTDVAITFPTPNVSEVSTKVGELVTLHCSAKGYPEPDYHWIKAPKDGLHGIVTVRQSQNLTLGYSADESGRYKCAAVQPRFEQRVIREASEVAIVSVK